MTTTSIQIRNIKIKFKLYASQIKLRRAKGNFVSDTEDNEVFYMFRDECNISSKIMWDIMAYGSTVMFFHRDNYFHFKDISVIEKSHIKIIIASTTDEDLCYVCKSNTESGCIFCMTCNILYCKPCCLKPCVKCKKNVGTLVKK